MSWVWGMRSAWTAGWIAFSINLHAVVGWSQPVAGGCSEPEVDREIERALDQRTRNRELAALHLRALVGRCPVPRVRAQLGLEEEIAQHWRDAYPLLRDALASSNDAWVTSQRVRLERALHDVEQHLPRLSPQTNVPGAELRVNGQFVGRLPLPSPWVLIGGSGAVELSAPGHQVFRRTVSLADGEVFREMLTLVPGSSDSTAAAPNEPLARASEATNAVLPPRPPSTLTRSPSRLGAPSSAAAQSTRISGQGVGPWVVAGAGVAMMAMGGVFWALREGAVGNCTVEADAIACPTAADATRAEGASGMGIAANVSLGVGLAATAGGVLWLLLGRSTEASAPRARVSVAPLASGAVLSIGGSF